MSRKSLRERLRWLFVLISLVALGWAVLLVHNALPELQTSMPKLHLWWLLLPLAGCITSGYIGFEGFRALFLHVKPGAYRRLALAHLYFVAQLMKHLPGRIWGVAYQAAAGEGATLMEWASIMVANMVIVTGLAVWMTATVLGFAVAPSWGVLAFFVGLLAYFVGWHKRTLGGLLALMGKVPGRISGKLRLALLPFVKVGPGFKLKLLLLFGSYWLVYLISWAGYGYAWPGLTAYQGMILCAMYTAAWMVGYFSFITPSGLGIRELVFVFLAHGYPADAVAGLAVFGRVMLLIADVALGALYSPFTPKLLSRSTEG